MTYNLHLPALDLTIEPQENGHFQILEGDHKVGSIYAKLKGTKLEWRSEEPLSMQFVNEMGALIQEHRLGF